MNTFRLPLRVFVSPSMPFQTARRTSITPWSSFKSSTRKPTSDYGRIQSQLSETTHLTKNHRLESNEARDIRKTPATRLPAWDTRPLFVRSADTGVRNFPTTKVFSIEHCQRTPRFTSPIPRVLLRVQGCPWEVSAFAP